MPPLWPRYCPARYLSRTIAEAWRRWPRDQQADSLDTCARVIMLDEERERRRPGDGQRVIAHRGG